MCLRLHAFSLTFAPSIVHEGFRLCKKLPSRNLKYYSPAGIWYDMTVYLQNQLLLVFFAGRAFCIATRRSISRWRESSKPNAPSSL